MHFYASRATVTGKYTFKHFLVTVALGGTFMLLEQQSPENVLFSHFSVTVALRGTFMLLEQQSQENTFFVVFVECSMVFALFEAKSAKTTEHSTTNDRRRQPRQQQRR